MKRVLISFIIGSSLLGGEKIPANPTPEFYRKLLLSLPTEGEFKYRPLGAKPVTVSYKFKWNLTNDRNKHEPEVPTYNIREWVDWNFVVGPESFITVQGDPVPYGINCVWITGH